jgi:hypothetical protein
MESILNRVKLLIEYDTTKTLSENMLIVEQLSSADDLARAFGILGKSASDDIVRAAGIVDDLAKPISSMDDFLKLYKEGKVTAQNVGKVQTQLLKNTRLPITQKTAMVDNFVTQSIKKSRGVGKTSTQISDDLVSKGYPKDVADDVGNKLSSHWKGNKSGPSAFKSQGGKQGSNVIKSKVTRSGKTKNLKPKRTKNPNPKAAEDAAKIEAELAKGGKPWPAWVKWGTGLGIGALALWWYFHDSGDVVTVPEDIPEEEPTTDNDSGGGSTSGGGAGYTVCPGPQYTQGCKSETIRKVQGCLDLVADGKFGPKTQAALEAKGYKTGFTDADVDKICNRVQASPDLPQEENPYKDWTPDEAEGGSETQGGIEG